jgi:hypothetical protein
MCQNLIRLAALGLLLSVAAGVANAGIIAYWPFDEGTGDTAKDVVGGANAKLTGISWVTGKVGGFAAESPRGTASILVNPGPTPKTKDLSLAFWMVDTYDSYHTLMNKGVDSSQAGHYILLRPTSEDSPLRFRIGGFQAYGGWGTECRVPVGSCKDGEWVHVVCTYDGTGAERRLQSEDRHCRSQWVLPGYERSHAAAIHRGPTRDVRRQGGRGGDLGQCLDG